MASLITCPSCRRRLRLPAGLGDQWVRCPGCGLSFPPRSARVQLRTDEGGDPSAGEWLPPASTPGPEKEPQEAGPRACPSCGGPLGAGAVSCRSCGEDLEGDHVEAWRESYPGLRRDCEPHRGRWIALLGNASVVFAALALPLCGLPGLLGLPLGIAAWVMGNADLAKIRSGAMDPRGSGPTRLGRECGIVGTVLSAAVGAGWLLLWLVLGLS
jgi:hypothetical protein